MFVGRWGLDYFFLGLDYYINYFFMGKVFFIVLYYVFNNILDIKLYSKRCFLLMIKLNLSEYMLLR